MKLYQKIRRLRIEKNLTQNYIADELGIDVTNYGRLERGNSKITLDRLSQIAGILGVELASFFTEDTSSTELKPMVMECLSLLQEVLREIKELKK